MSYALVVITLFFLLSIYLALRSKKGKTMDHEGWSVGGRSYGALLVFLLSAGEIYTTFTFLGGSGWAYGKGPAILYTLAVNAFMGYFYIGCILVYGDLLSRMILEPSLTSLGQNIKAKA